jgi:protein-glutamine gamma-glutamyltransferase
MTGPVGASVSRPGRAATATATAVLVGTGAVSWWWVLRGSLVGIALVVAVATVTVLVAAELLAYRRAAVLLAVGLAVGMWAAGVPAGQLPPHAWPSLLARLAGGLGRLTALGGTGGPIGDDPWPLAAWLLGAGAVWIGGAALATSGPSARRRGIAFGLLAAPWIAAVAARQNDRAAWQGAAVLVAGLLWLADRRRALRRVLALALAAALVSVATAQAVGPRTRWFTRPPPSAATVPFLTLEDELTYGPLQGRRSGATLLQVTAAQPALWRMRTLSLFAGPGWRVDSPLPELPQPTAELVEVKVVVRGLANDLMVAPGRINAVHTDGQAAPVAGETWQLTPPPRRGDTYQVQASVVHASAEQLRTVPAPTDPRLRAYTSLLPGYGWHGSAVVPLFGQPPDPEVTATLNLTPYGPVAALARRLAAGATSQWEVVARVHRYLRDGGRFRYTTNLPRTGAFPLVDFLLRDHAGYCQHFAGAAALLLRLAGVPTRVVVGFAPGVPQPGGRYTVRGTDAHAWIEVYFQGYGWVAFNPTPPAAPANIPRQVDPLAPAATGGGHDDHRGPEGLGWLTISAILAALATASVLVTRRRTRRGPVPLGPLLEGLVRRTGGHVQPSSTLTELGIQLARLVGPQTAALAAQAERARFAPGPAAPTPRPRIQLARALASDLGPRRALMALITPATTRRGANGPRQPADADAGRLNGGWRGHRGFAPGPCAVHPAEPGREDRLQVRRAG